VGTQHINRVVMSGNLTRDPELRHTQSGMPVCSLRVANNQRRKSQAGDWEDDPGFYDVTVWGKQGENCAQYLAKGRGVAIDGRLKWREYTDKDGNKRQAVDIVADMVQFLGDGGDRRDDAPRGGGDSPTDVPADVTGFDPAPAKPAYGVSGDDEIPF
jgi:single-strand DNA-binding protein